MHFYTGSWIGVKQLVAAAVGSRSSGDGGGTRPLRLPDGVYFSPSRPSLPSLPSLNSVRHSMTDQKRNMVDDDEEEKELKKWQQFSTPPNPRRIRKFRASI